MNNKRVVITGLGVVSSIGIGVDEFWPNLLAGKSGISEVESFDISRYERKLGGEIKDFDAEKYVSQRSCNETGRASQLAIAAAKLALKDAKVTNNKDIGVIIGTTMADAPVIEIMNKIWVDKGDEQISPQLVPQYPGNALASNVAFELNLRGFNAVIPTACAAGNYSIGYAHDLIKQGKAQAMLAGGADAFSRIAYTGFGRLFAMSKNKCRPFDKDRDGMMVGEGAGIVFLETLESAKKRGAHIYAEVLGYGLSCDAHHMTQPSAEGIARCITKALKESDVQPEEVDYISAHGTGTPQNDRTECQAIKQVFCSTNSRESTHSTTLRVDPELAERVEGSEAKLTRKHAVRENSCIPPVSSIKSMLGHTMGAASAIEAIACCLALRDQVMPPTINYETPDAECDLDCVPNKARKKSLTIALNNSCAFGGNNACLLLKGVS